MLIGVGHDLQQVLAMRSKRDLCSPGVLFSERECAHCASAVDPEASFTGLFCAKEALFKALPIRVDFHWTDIEIVHARSHAPRYELAGNLGQEFSGRSWCAALSISHSGDYASAVALIWQATPPAQSAA